MEMHVKSIHLKKKDFQCSDCNKSFSSNGDLNGHRKSVHFKIRDFQWTDCDNAFSFKSTLLYSLYSIHALLIACKHFKVSTTVILLKYLPKIKSSGFRPKLINQKEKMVIF